MRMISIPTTSQEAKNALALETVPKIVEALTKPLTEQEKYKGKFELPKQPRIAFTGTFDQVQDFFLGDLSKYTDDGAARRIHRRAAGHPADRRPGRADAQGDQAQTR